MIDWANRIRGFKSGPSQEVRWNIGVLVSVGKGVVSVQHKTSFLIGITIVLEKMTFLDMMLVSKRIRMVYLLYISYDDI